jgi:streptogramin lyase
VLLALLLLLVAGTAPTLTARIATGEHPCGVAAGFGAVWVANDGSGTLARVDPKTNRVTRRARIGEGVCSVATGAGFVWVTNYRTGAIVRVSPQSFAVRRVRVGAEPFDVLVTDGRVWATAWGDGKLVTIDPRTLRVLQRLDVGPYPAGLATRAGSVWVGFGRSATSVVRIDPTTADVKRVPVGVSAPAWFSSGTRDLWITGNDNALVHLDPESARMRGTTRFGRTLGHPSAGGDGTVWVPDKEIDRVFRVDPATGRPAGSFAGGDGAFEALHAFGSVWVTSYAGFDIWRFRPHAPNPAKVSLLIPCTGWNPITNPDPSGCTWLQKPPRPK